MILPSIFPFRVREGGQSNILTADVNLDKALAELGKSQKPEIALCVGNGGCKLAGDEMLKGEREVEALRSITGRNQQRSVLHAASDGYNRLC